MVTQIESSTLPKTSLDVLGVHINAVEITDVVAQTEHWVCGRVNPDALAATESTGEEPLHRKNAA